MTGTGQLTADTLRTERLQLDARTSDPSSPRNGEVWFREDLDSASNRVGELRWFDGSSVRRVPVFDRGVSGAAVQEVLRVDSADGVGFAPVIERGDAAYPQLSLRHAGTDYGLHDSRFGELQMSVDAQLNDGSLDVTVEQDPDQDGTYENSDSFSVSVSNGETFALSNVDSLGGDYRVEFAFSTPSKTATPAFVNSVELFDTIRWETAADWDSATTESGVAHESVSGSDHADASVLRQGYSYANPVAANSIQISYPLDETTGSSFNDAVSSGTASAADVTQGASGLLGTSAVSFANTTDEILSTDIDIPEASAVTINLWYRTNSLTGDTTRTLLETQRELDGITARLEAKSDGQISVSLINNNSTIKSLETGTSIIADGSFHMLTGVLSDSSNSVAAFQDATKIGEKSGVGEFRDIDQFSIGDLENSFNRGFEGVIDLPQIWQAELSASQIQRIYDVATTSATLVTGDKQL